MERAIGVIDSGVGGLTVAHELMRQLPKEKLIYLGDTLRCPYGPRPEEEVRQYTWEMVHFLLQKKIKMLVIACNTATAFTLKELEEHLNIPVIGVIQPGARAAIKHSRTGQIGVIGTEGTIKSNAYPQALQKIKENLTVTPLACPKFVPLVERGITKGQEAEAIVRESLKPFTTGKQIDTLILGCTHYPLLTETIQKTIGQDVEIISSGEETAREVSTILDVHQLLAKHKRTVYHEFFTTGDLQLFTQISHTIFNKTFDSLRSVRIEKAFLEIMS